MSSTQVTRAKQMTENWGVKCGEGNWS